MGTIKVPEISSRLGTVRIQMKLFADLIKDESSIIIQKEKLNKKNKKKKRSRENPEETDKVQFKNETQIEGDDLDNFINTVIMHG